MVAVPQYGAKVQRMDDLIGRWGTAFGRDVVDLEKCFGVALSIE
jgi:hypothetical protein